jgi:KDO2-lipid IV(A) lauroyltransferase
MSTTLVKSPASALLEPARVPSERAEGGAGATPSQSAARGSRFRYDGLFWRRLAYLGSAYGPEWWKRTAPPFVAAIIFALVKQNREGAVENLRRVLGPRGRVAELRGGLRLFSEFAHCVTETLELHSPRARELAIEVGLDEERELGDVLRRPRGLVVLTSHFGNWEVAARVMQRFGRPVNVVMAREANPSVEAFQRETRERMRLRVIHSDSSLFSSFNMIHALRRGEVVAMQIDRSAPGHVTREVPFFGRAARFQYGPFVLARLAGVPILPVFAVRTGMRSYRILPEALRSIPRAAGETETLGVMQDVVRGLERHVRDYPYQWFQFAPFWEDAPAGRVR